MTPEKMLFALLRLLASEMDVLRMETLISQIPGLLEWWKSETGEE